MTHRRSIAVDFDGVIHAYTSPWTSPVDIHDPPVPGALDWLRGLLADGWLVFIHTARLMHSVPPDHTTIPETPLAPRAAAINAWFDAHGAADIALHPSLVLWIAGGKPHAEVYVDDRAWRFEGTFPTREEIDAAVPWNQR